MNMSIKIFTNPDFVIFGGGILLAVTASFLGVFLVSRKMALISDALSHVALPGIGLAYILNFDIFLGAILVLAPVLFLLILIERKTKLDFNSLIGIIFALSLAVGVFILPNEELLEGLFGNIGGLYGRDFILIALFSALILAFLIKYYRELMLISFSEEWAKIKKINIFYLNVMFFFATALVISLGIKLIGALLISSLLIIPASSALNLARNAKQMIFFSVICGAFGITFGLYFAKTANITSFTGPVIIISETIIFALTFVLKKFRKI